MVDFAFWCGGLVLVWGCWLVVVWCCSLWCLLGCYSVLVGVNSVLVCSLVWVVDLFVCYSVDVNSLFACVGLVWWMFVLCVIWCGVIWL